VVGSIATFSVAATAQLAPDGTLGTESTVITPNQTIQGLPSDLIEGGALRGVNLFHSFQEFNVDTGRGVFFANPDSVTNIFTRVTGSNPSNILGRLGVLGQANLYLLNPNGIVFGSGASLDVQGSFFASTSNAIDLGNGESFSTNPATGAPLITVQPEATFSAALQSINNQATLQVGQNLNLNGTQLINTGTLQAGADLNINSNSLDNTGLLQSGQNIVILSVNQFANSGAVQSGQDVNITTTDLGNTGTIQTGQNLITSSATLINSGFLQSNQNISIGGTPGNAVDVNFATTSIIEAGQNLIILGDTINNAGTLTSIQNLSIEGNQINNSGALQAGQNLNINGTDLSNNGMLESGQDLELEVANDIAMDSLSSLSTSNGNLTVTAGRNLAIQQATIAAQTVNLSAAGGLVLNSNQISSTGDLTFSGNTIQILDTALTPSIITVGRNLVISSAQGIEINTPNIESLIQATENLTIGSSDNLSIRGALIGDAITMSVGGELQLSDSQVISLAGGINIGTGGNALLERSQLLSATNTSVFSQGVLQIRDSSTAPFVVSAGGNLNLQGINGVDIQAQNDFASILQSGGSLNIISNNGAVTTAINLDTAELSIAANNNISLGDYSGSSLQLTASNGFISAGTIDTSSATDNGGNVLLSGARGISVAAINTFSTAPTGNGGTIELTASNGGISVTEINTSAETSTGGTITAIAADRISVGRIDAFSAGSGLGGSVNLVAGAGITTTDIDTSAAEGSAGNITMISDRGSIDTTAGNLFANTGFTGVNGGVVRLQSGGDIAAGSIFTDGGTQGGGGNIQIQANGTVTIAPNQVIASGTFGIGNGGDLSITGRSIDIGEGSQLLTTTIAAGNAGRITLQAADEGSIQIRSGSVLDASAFGSATGDAASISLFGGTLSLTNTEVYTDVINGDGAGGQVTWTASSGGIALVNSNIFTGTVGNGSAGAVTVTTLADGDIALTNSAIFSDTTGAGSGGNVRLTALAGGNVSLTDSFIYTNTSGPGFSGNLNLSTLTGNLTTTNSTIFTGSFGAGIAGDLNLIGRSITSVNSTLDTAAFDAGATGNIMLTAINNGTVFFSGGRIFADTFEANTGNGGLVSIQGGNIIFDDGFSLNATNGGGVNGSNLAIEAANQIDLRNGSSLITTVAANATGAGGSIRLQANSVTLSEASRIDANTEGIGSGGSIQLITPTTRLTEQSEINAKTSGSGQAGSVVINGAGGVLSLDRDSRISAAVESAGGNGGEIQVNVGRLELQSGGQLVSSTSGTGTAGSIHVMASQNVVLSGQGSNSSGLFAQSNGAGQAGDLMIATPQLLIENGAEVSVTTRGSGMGGRLTIATEQLRVLGGEISASTEGDGAGGFLTINASRSLELASGGRLTARSLGTGNAGSLEVATDQFTIRTGAEVSTASTGTGNAGRISLAANSLTVTDGGRITSRSTGSGNAGSINIRVSNRLDLSAGEISASSEQGGGGQVTIAAQDIRLDRSSLISTSVSDGNGGGGDISIRARNSFFAFDDSDILANAQFGGGGTIVIDSPLFIADLFATVGRNPGQDLSRFRGNGRVDISSASIFGINGTVQIPDISFIQNSLTPLEDDFTVPDQIVAGSCLARRGAGRSSFVITGTGGLARTPYTQAVGRYSVLPVQPLPPDPGRSQLPVEPVQVATTASTPYLAWKPGDPIQEAQGFIRTPDGRTVLGTNPQLIAVAKAQDLVCGF
jgi:filamentous hemagglutinin family protein